jgi:CrcB protein
MMYVWIALGSAAGGMARYWSSGVVARLFGETFPWGTLVVNLAGSFLIALYFTLTEPGGRVLAAPEQRQFVMFGLMGGFTTFSSFSLQTLNLMRDGEWTLAAFNVVGSVAVCVAAAWIGHMAGALVNR